MFEYESSVRATINWIPSLNTTIYLKGNNQDVTEVLTFSLITRDFLKIWHLQRETTAMSCNMLAGYA